jgi:hypothetical protein
LHDHVLRLQGVDQRPHRRGHAEAAQRLGRAVHAGVVGGVQRRDARRHGRLRTDQPQPLDGRDPRLAVGMIDRHVDQRCDRFGRADPRQRLDEPAADPCHRLRADRGHERRHRRRIGDPADLRGGAVGRGRLVELPPQPLEAENPLLAAATGLLGPLDEPDLLHRPPGAAVPHESALAHHLLRTPRRRERLGRAGGHGQAGDQADQDAAHDGFSRRSPIGIIVPPRRVVLSPGPGDSPGHRFMAWLRMPK